MAATIVNRRSRNSKPRSPPPAHAAGPAVTRDAGELPSREALVARLEAQRTELLRAMSCVNLARRMIEQHLVRPQFGGVLPLGTRQGETYRQRVLEALNAAGDALGTACPMLERIAEALAVEEILKEHAPARPRASSAKRSAARG